MKTLLTPAIVGLVTLVSCAGRTPSTANLTMEKKNMTTENSSPGVKTETATLANGCFWCTEAIFEELNGVISATSGYTGGQTENPTYKQVCTGETGHAEALQIEYDPAKISFDELLA